MVIVMLLSKIKFIISAPNKNSWPNDKLNEICFLGKSNVGKSSLLNAISNNNKLARVSATPGCTKLLNFFEKLTNNSPNPITVLIIKPIQVKLRNNGLDSKN